MHTLQSQIIMVGSISTTVKRVTNPKDDSRFSLDRALVRRVSDPPGVLPSPKRHAADLAHHNCTTCRRQADPRAPKNLQQQVGVDGARRQCTSAAPPLDLHMGMVRPMASCTPDLPLSAVSEFGDAAMSRSCCGAPQVSMRCAHWRRRLHGSHPREGLRALRSAAWRRGQHA